MAEAAPLRGFATGPRFSLPAVTGDRVMTEESRCRWVGDVAAYALGALDPGEQQGVEEHLATCARCAAELEWMVPVVGVLSGASASDLLDLEAMLADDRRAVRIPAARAARIG